MLTKCNSVKHRHTHSSTPKQIETDKDDFICIPHTHHTQTFTSKHKHYTYMQTDKDIHTINRLFILFIIINLVRSNGTVSIDREMAKAEIKILQSA